MPSCFFELFGDSNVGSVCWLTTTVRQKLTRHLRFLRLESEKGKREETKTKERNPLTSDITGCLYWNWWDYCWSCSTAKIPTIHSHLVGNKIKIHIPRDSPGISKSLKSEKNECQNIRMNKFKLLKFQNPERLLYFSYRFFFSLKKSHFSHKFCTFIVQ